ncbi:GMC family oxidoreductase [Caldithrix abyssi]|nr:GMC family oxidoreductase [Caldithrix abyssi]
MTPQHDYDYVIIGSGFGGSVSALRLSEKGYKVLVIEKGKWWTAADFPKTIWNLRKWIWAPILRLYGFFQLTYYRHVGILSGVGVGGGSLVYANTLPVPKQSFYTGGSWGNLADWESELKGFYPLALKMLGANQNPRLEPGDEALKALAQDLGKTDQFHPTRVSVYFGQEGVTVPDPYFEGKGPDRTGCIYCGGCMVGCRFNSKNTLDKNYLYLAQQNGAKIQAESKVTDVKPIGGNGEEGYRITWEASTSLLSKKSGTVTASGVVFSAGVLGTVKLLLTLMKSSLPKLSKKVGGMVRTNSEALMPVTALDKKTDYSKGIAIGSILHTSKHTHVEPVRYSKGSGFWRLFMLPRVSGKNFFVRLLKIGWDYIRHPIQNLKVLFVDDWAKRTQVMLFMQTLESTLQFKKGRLGSWMRTGIEKGEKPTPFISEADDLIKKYAKKVNGKPMMPNNEALFGIPTTAHILGGACMGHNSREGVIDKNNCVFGYENMLVCDGAMISANPGVNPSLTITALTERAMSKIPPK